MEAIENFISSMDIIIDTPKKRHMLGGILISVSFFFGGLAITMMTTKLDEEYKEEEK